MWKSSQNQFYNLKWKFPFFIQCCYNCQDQFVSGDHLLQNRCFLFFLSSKSPAFKRCCAIPVAQFVRHSYIHSAHISDISVRHNTFVRHSKNFLDFSDRQMRVCVHQSCDFVRDYRSRVTQSFRVFNIKVFDTETRKPFSDHTFRTSGP